jgi:hypothetical protein
MFSAKTLTGALLTGLLFSGFLILLCFFWNYDSFLNFIGQSKEETEFYSETKFHAFQIRALIVGIILVLFSIYVFLNKKWFIYFQETFSYNFKEGKHSILRGKNDFMNWNSLTKIIFFTILFIGMFLRVSSAFNPITYDEAFTYIQYASKPYYIIVTDYSYPNNHILFTLFAKMSTSIFGVSELALRLPSIIASFLLLFLGFILANRFKSRIGAFAFIFFLAVVPALVEYGTFARGYSFLILFTLFIIYSLDRWIETKQCYHFTRMNVILILGIWAVPIYAFLLIPISILLWIKMKDFKSIVGIWLKVIAVSMLLYLPAILFYGISCLWNPPLYALGDSNYVPFFDMLSIFSKDVTHLSHAILLIVIVIVFIFSIDFKNNIHLFTLLFMGSLMILLLLKPELLVYRIWIFSLVPIFWMIGDGIRIPLLKNAVFIFIIVFSSVNFFVHKDKYSGRVERFYGLEKELIQLSKDNVKEVNISFPKDAPAEFYSMKNKLDLVFVK